MKELLLLEKPAKKLLKELSLLHTRELEAVISYKKNKNKLAIIFEQDNLYNYLQDYLYTIKKEKILIKKLLLIQN